MSQGKNRYQAERWWETAQEDLRTAELLAGAGAHAHACFHAQQTGEKALKALWYALDSDPWGHSIQRLVQDFPGTDSLPGKECLLEAAGLLDQYYIPTRYPNGLPDLTPGQVYRKGDANRGLEAARFILDACRQWLDEVA